MNPLNPYFCRIIFTFLILILLSPIISLGEILKLKSGGVLNGEIVSESKTEVTIITRGVKMIIQKQNIESTTHEPEDIKYIRRGELATKNGKYYEAYTDYTTALGLNPNNALAHKYYD